MFAVPAFGEKFLHVAFFNTDARVGDGETDAALHFFERERDVSHGGVAAETEKRGQAPFIWRNGDRHRLSASDVS